MRVGYCRVSTAGQHIEAQVERLADCEKVFSEKESGSKASRAQLAACLEFVRQGDVLVTTRLDRLARSVAHLCSIVETLQKKGVELVVIDQQIDTTSPTGKLLFHVIAAIAEFELGIRKDAQRAGIAHARATGKHLGRLPRLNDDDRAHVVEQYDGGERVATLARRFRVSARTIDRCLAAAGRTCATQ